jgi:Kdo2-lipid IVA lauroyltransferase/acyltransferase
MRRGVLWPSAAAGGAKDDGLSGSPGRRGPSHRLQALVLDGVSWFLRALPEPAALLLGAGIGWVAGSVLRIRRGTVDENLRRAFPERSPRWRRRVAARVFPHIGREAATLMRLAGLSTGELRARIETEGREVLTAALAEGKGVVVVTGHLGNWEIGGGSVALEGIPLDVVVQTQTNPLVDGRLRRSREALGMRVVYRHDAPREVLRSLRAGRVVALVADQNVRSGGLFVDFFGVPASTARGPALFALRTGAPFVLGTAHRLPGWRRARYRVRFRRLEPERSGDMERDVATWTRAYVGALEEAVREAPEQYFWPHKRWKTRPASGEERRERTEEPFRKGPV